MPKKNRNKKRIIKKNATTVESPTIENPIINNDNIALTPHELQRVECNGSLNNGSTPVIHSNIQSLNNLKPPQAQQVHLQVKIPLQEYMTLQEQYKRLEIEINRLNALIISKDNEKSELIKEISNLKNDEINRLKTLVEQLTEEKKNLLEQLKQYKQRIEKLEESNERLEKSNKSLEESNEQLKSQSMIQDLLANMFRHFIILNKNDQNFKPFIKISNMNDREEIIDEINLSSFHRVLRNKKSNEANFIKLKFTTFTSNLLTYDQVQTDFYKNLCESRNYNPVCHGINNIIHYNYDELDSFLVDTKNKIEEMKFHKEPANQIFNVLKTNIPDSEIESIQSNTMTT